MQWTDTKIEQLKDKDNKKVLMSSLDVQRPAAQEQLATLGKQVDVDTQRYETKRYLELVDEHDL